VVRSRSTPPDEAAALDELVEENALMQMEHPRTHPPVAGRLAHGSPPLSGWVCDIARGAVRICSEDQRKFLPVESEEQGPTAASK